VRARGHLGISFGSLLRKGEAFAYVERNQSLKDLKELRWDTRVLWLLPHTLGRSRRPHHGLQGDREKGVSGRGRARARERVIPPLRRGERERARERRV